MQGTVLINYYPIDEWLIIRLTGKLEPYIWIVADLIYILKKFH